MTKQMAVGRSMNYKPYTLLNFMAFVLHFDVIYISLRKMI